MDPGSVLDRHTNNISNLPTELTFLLNELREKDIQFYEYRKKLQQYDSQIHKFIKAKGSLIENPKEEQLYPKIQTLFEECEKLQKEKCKILNTALYLVTKHLTGLENDVRTLEKDGILQSLTENSGSILDMDIDKLSNESRMSSVGASSVSSTKKVQKKGNIRLSITPQASVSTIEKDGSIKRYVKRQKMDPEYQELAGTPVTSPNGGTTKSEKLKLKIEESDVDGYSKSVQTPIDKRHDFGSVANTPNRGVDGEDQTLYCFCQQVSFGEMVACDNSKCKYEWFHYKCVGLTAEPTGKWFCSDCIKRNDLKKKRRSCNKCTIMR